MTATPVQTALDGLDALLAAATPGEWYADENIQGDGFVVMADGLRRAHLPSSRLVTNAAADAALIVALRNTAPAMLAAIRAAYGVTEKLQGTAEVTGGKVNGYVFATDLRAALDEALGASGE